MLSFIMRTKLYEWSDAVLINKWCYHCIHFLGSCLLRCFLVGDVTKSLLFPFWLLIVSVLITYCFRFAPAIESLGFREQMISPTVFWACLNFVVVVDYNKYLYSCFVLFHDRVRQNMCSCSCSAATALAVSAAKNLRLGLETCNKHSCISLSLLQYDF